MSTSMNNGEYSGRATIVRRSHLAESQHARQYLLEEGRKPKRIDLHSSKVKGLLARIKANKQYVRKLRRRRSSKLSSTTPAKIINRYVYQTKKISKQRFHQYKAIDGYKYKALIWLRHKDQPSFRYHVTVTFMYMLRSGIFVRRKSEPWYIPFSFNSTNTNRKYIPVGLAALLICLGIPDSVREAMLRDLSQFAPPHNSASHAVLCMEILIITLQVEDEDVLGTRFRSMVDQLCRSQYIEHVLTSEEHLQPVNLLMHAQEHASSSSCNMQGVEEDQGEDLCSICLEEIRPGQGDCSYLPCSHLYHYHCIFKWLSHYNFCPTCRHPYCRIVHPSPFIDHRYLSQDGSESN